MIFNFTKHQTELYNTLLHLSRNLFFYNEIKLKDTFETRIYLMFVHFSIILIINKQKKIKFPQKMYDDLFHCIENNLRELGFGDVSVNKKMKDFNKILYDILLKVNKHEAIFEIDENIMVKYFNELNKKKSQETLQIKAYFDQFYHFCFDKDPKTMIKDALKFRIK